MRTGFGSLLVFHFGLFLGLAQPVITSQPQNQTVIAGETATFSVGATGAPPLSYQWRSHANAPTFTNIPFGTETTLVLTNVQPTARRFAVVVTDSGGLSTTSSPLVTLTVLLAPTITTQPTNQAVEPGGTATFGVVATGAAPLSYQWRSNGVNLLGRTSTNLHLINVQSTSAADYTVVITNVAGSVTSQVATLTVSVLAGFDNEMISFMTANNVSAGTLAIMKDGRLLLKRGFGWRDRATTQPMDADGRMRLASNSKEFAAAALKRLIAQFALALTNRAYPFTGLQPYNGTWGDARYGDVTIEHLVAHRCGWDQSAVSFASMTTVGNALGLDRTGSSRDLIAYELTKPLQFAPGSRFAYSSVGYVVLAQAVEKAAEVPYFEYVRREVLRPWGLHRTKPARTLEKLREWDEPWYDSGAASSGLNTADFPTTELVPQADGAEYPQEAAVGAGEMISSAEDMVRFAQAHWISHGVAFPPNATVPAVMNGDLRSRRSGQVGAQSGWIAGTRTFVLQNTNGVDLAVMINREVVDPGFSDFVSRLKAVSERIVNWPGDNTPQIDLGATSFGVGENESHLTVGIRRSGDSSGAVTINYTTLAGTALEGADLVATSGIVSFGPDEITALITIPILDDTIEETSETFIIALSNPTGGASLGISAATVTIEDDDTPRLPPLIQLTAPGAGFVSPAGSNVTLTVTTSAFEGQITRVEYYASPSVLGEENKPPYAFIWKKPGIGAYLLTARAIDSRGLTSTSPPVRITIGTPPVDAGDGTIRREFWQRRPGTAMTFLTNYQHYPSRPTGWEILTSFEAPTNWGDFFGTRIRGFLDPPATGDYVFWVAARDRAELWLSADSNPSNKAVIASVQSPTAPRAWEQSASQRSAPIRLTAGQKSYIELLHKAEIGQDHAAVGWQLPGGQLERPIPGIRLLPFDAQVSPRIQTPNFSAGEFGFNLNLTVGNTVIIEDSPDLLNWFPLRTNTAAGSSLSFEDTGTGNSPHRFYRARLLP